MQWRDMIKRRLERKSMAAPPSSASIVASIHTHTRLRESDSLDCSHMLLADGHAPAQEAKEAWRASAETSGERGSGLNLHPLQKQRQQSGPPCRSHDLQLECVTDRRLDGCRVEIWTAWLSKPGCVRTTFFDLRYVSSRSAKRYLRV